MYHITLIVCASYFVNFNNNTFKLKKLLFFVHLRSQQKRTEKVIYNCLFEVFRALVRSVEWSGVSVVDSAGSVPGPPQRRRSPQCASCADVHYRMLVQWTPLFANRFWKPSTPRLLHFLFGNSLVNRFTPYVFDSQTFFYKCLVCFC